MFLVCSLSVFSRLLFFVRLLVLSHFFHALPSNASILNTSPDTHTINTCITYITTPISATYLISSHSITGIG